MLTIHFLHAMPVAWRPAPGKYLVTEGLGVDRLREMCAKAKIVSHVRYEDHAARISEELVINLPASGVNAPSPFNLPKGHILVVASLQPGSTDISYVSVFDGTSAIKEADVRF